MKKFLLASVLVAALPVLSGCWSKKEVVEAPVAAVTEEMTTPSEEVSEPSKEEYVA
ncbi:MAG: hypothetical protein NTZ68_01895 [Candidatus Dependentiae bacterium]|nr:hypothetical protein [Candidatus Dependentiae bacterium]